MRWITSLQWKNIYIYHPTIFLFYWSISSVFFHSHPFLLSKTLSIKSMGIKATCLPMTWLMIFVTFSWWESYAKTCCLPLWTLHSSITGVYLEQQHQIKGLSQCNSHTSTCWCFRSFSCLACFLFFPCNLLFYCSFF